MKTFEGTIISDKMAKVATVLVERKFRHAFYGKIIKRRKKVHAVNEIAAKLGQLVRIAEIRPRAKTVNFKILEIIK